ncbi:electron transport complex subunit RsxC [Crenobacter caeni]|uniref:Ion-translocating oxidoreductase complex subunit C n=1 Tax=Crenobacter caeni TaxID=2705474 RepID=A0A6B2KUY1_9NEIS|nr:electron transport complex subunit RsxC [Crenobacter caeni]NDV13914.1 electron transport complex subunit RsxC [Crenobacter caeni]
MRQLYRFHGGIHPPEFKELSNGTPIVSPPLPARLVVPVSQHLGAPAKPCVAVGEAVLKGQLIACADGRVSAAVHAPTSGRVVAVGEADVAHPSGLLQTCISIETDGLDAWIEKTPLPNWQEADNETVRAFLRDMGVVGQGGAVFPTALKLGVSHLDTLIVNGAECEPFISCDDRLMRERAQEIVEGVRIAGTLTGAREMLIGVEDNKPEAIAALTAACAGTPIEVVSVPTLYPSGGAKQLIRILTGKEVPHGMRSTDFGVQCFNVGTLYSLKRAIVDGEPVISRIVTLTGELERCGNAEVLLGTPVEHLLAWAGVNTRCDGVIVGGPMMGFPLESRVAGVGKAVNCLIARSDTLLPPRPPAMPCIRCGACADACPAQLQPMELYWHAKAREFGPAQEANLFDCIECGACSYVCPSQLPLVDFYKFAKDEIWAAERDKKAADRARARHEFRQFRIERDKTEKAERLAARAATPAPAATPDAAKADAIRAAMAKAAERKADVAPPTEDAKRAAIKAAMARAAAKKAEQQDAGTPPKPALDDAKRAAIEAAMARAAAKKAEQQGTATSEAEAVPAPAPKPAIDDTKRAAIEAAMARAAAKKAEQQSTATSEAEAVPASAPKPAIDDAKRAAIEAAMARAAARKAEQQGAAAAEAEAAPAPAPKPAIDDAKRAAIEAAMARAAAKKAEREAQKGQDPQP